MYHTSALYYVLTVSVQNKPQRYEVYRYDCESKKPTLLAKVPVKEFLGDAQIAYISPTEILIIQYSDEE